MYLSGNLGFPIFRISRKIIFVLMSIISGHWVLLQVFWAGGRLWDKPLVRELPTEMWGYLLALGIFWWEDRGMAVISWASVGTWWKEGDPSAALSLEVLFCGHQLQCNPLPAQGPWLKLVKQVLPTHRMPRTNGYPQGGRNVSTSEDFLGCTRGGHERVVFILQNTPLEEVPLTAWAEHRDSACLRLASSKADQKCVCELSRSPRAPTAFHTLPAKRPAPSPEPLCSPQPCCLPFPLPTTI